MNGTKIQEVSGHNMLCCQLSKSYSNESVKLQYQSQLKLRLQRFLMQKTILGSIRHTINGFESGIFDNSRFERVPPRTRIL